MKISLRRLLVFASSFGGRSRASSRPLPYHPSRSSASRASRMAASGVSEGGNAAAAAAAPVFGAAPDAGEAVPVVGAPDASPVVGAPDAPDATPVVDAPDDPDDTPVVDAPDAPDDPDDPDATPVVGAAETAAVGDDGAAVGDDAAAAAAGGRRREGEWFRVSDSVTLALHRGSITDWFVNGKTDAIVNAANSRMLGGGGVDGAIHRAAGPQLRAACEEFPEGPRGVRCPVGEARITQGFLLRASKVIHTVGPVYNPTEKIATLLRNAYRNSLKVAIEHDIEYIAFPAISCGVYRYPAAKAASVSLSAIKEASVGLSEVHFVLFEQSTYSCWMKEATKLFEHI